MDLTIKEVCAQHGLPAPHIGWAYREQVEAAMKEYAAQEAKSYASWLSNQVLRGRTAHKLWLDYKAEGLDQQP